MNSLNAKAVLSAIGIVAVLTGPVFAQSSVLGAVDVSDGELPQYEVMGFPISPLQMSVLKPGGIEQSLTPDLTLQGVPASPHQLAVIGARTKQQIAYKLKKRRIWN